jgi:hypothetical protein
MVMRITNQIDEEEEEVGEAKLDLATNGIIVRCDSDIGICWEIKDQVYARNGILPRELKPISPRKKFYLTFLSKKYMAPMMNYSISEYFLPNGKLIYSNRCDQGHSACKHAETLKVLELFKTYSSQQYRTKKPAKPKPKRKVIKKCKCK